MNPILPKIVSKPQQGRPSLHIVHLALGGCLKPPPVAYGITADTGGHIAYVLDAAQAQAMRPDVDRVTIVTRLFEDDRLGPAYAEPFTPLSPKSEIVRIATDDRRYLEKEALAADLPAFARALIDYLAAQPRLPDVIHAHFADAASVAAAVRRRLHVPFVYTPHALGIDKRAAGEGDPVLDRRIRSERDALAAADTIVLSSRNEAEHQVAAYHVPAVADRVLLAAPGVPAAASPATTDTIADRLGDWLTAPDKPILLVIARPVRKKNIAALLRAYAAAPALRDAANIVVLAGQHDGRSSTEEREVLAELRALAATPGLTGRVALPPHHHAADVAGLYRRAARGGVFVNPALHEPFGLTLLEAAAAGVPVVATHAGGAAEIVTRIGHGLSVDPRDESAIAAACLSIVSDPALHHRFAAAARRGVGRYDWRRYAAATVARYETLLPTPGLLACDIDGTLTGCAEGAHAFAGWAATRDIPYAIATGRCFDQARAIVAKWNLPEPDVYLVDVGSTAMLRTAGGAWRRCEDHAARLDADWHRQAVVDDLASLALVPQAGFCQTPHKLSYFGSAADADRVRARLADAALPAVVIHSHGTLIDVLPPSGGKAAAIAGYAGRTGLPLAACVAAGDSGNDADMLAACGRAIIVANADDDLDHLAPRRGLFRATRPHAAGVLQGLEAHGLVRTIPTP